MTACVRSAVDCTTQCTWCEHTFTRGSLMANMSHHDFLENMTKYLNECIRFDLGHNIGPQLEIIKCMKMTQPDANARHFCEDCSDFDIKVSRSGRVIRKPKRLENESYIKGSSIVGCDQFDRAFDGYGQDSYYDHAPLQTGNLTGFVVDDDVDIEDHEVEDDLEEEFSFTDEETDEETDDEYEAEMENDD